ncbi:MAG: energy-coupling factor ABC transporter permease [Verrucomicrobia bacterium]|nr:energy-coupling factor ABC transporter permease [Verrucomicrobiota bacterium]
MHIPDGFLSANTMAVTGGLAAAGLAVAIRQVNRTLPRSKTPLMGLAAAFVFAAQMLNFPVAGGTSGHLLGGVLAAVLLGPAAGAVMIAAVLILQCFLFSDGGVLALGANVFNMAIVGTVGGYGVYALVRRLVGGVRGQVTAVVFAAWCSTLLAAMACAGELAFSGTAAAGMVFPAMFGVHVLIGLCEALITALVVLAIRNVRPEFVDPEHNQARVVGWETPALGLVIVLGMAMFIAPFASSWPDGLETVAAQLGFEEHAKTLMRSLIPDYQVPGISSKGLATAIAGLVGTVIMFGAAWVVGGLLARRETKTGKPL